MAVVLLVAAGLMIRTVGNLTAVDPGFDAEPLLTLNVGTPRAEDAPSTSTDAPPSPFVVSSRELLERLEAVPGVASATLASDLPLQGGGSAIFYSAEGDTAIDAVSRPRAYVHRVTPEFFATMGIPLVHGRTFEPSELRPGSPAVIVSEALVQRFWPGLDPIGRRLKPGASDSAAPWLTIVGVAAEVKYRRLPDNPTQDPDLYFPYVERAVHAAILRTHVDPGAAIGSVRQAIRQLSEQAVVYNVAPMRDLVGVWTSQSRFTSWLMGVFAATALLLAIGGIYGVMSYLVARRTREFGIRLALGANRAEIIRVVMRPGGAADRAGPGARHRRSTRPVALDRTLLFGVSMTSVSAFAPVVLLAAAALLACAVPALRAARVDPMEALRAD